MARYIDADALCAEIDEYVYPITTNNLMGAADAYFRIKHLIEQAPTIEARPVVRGEWETDKEDLEWGNSLKRKHCTNCGKRPHFDKEKREFILSDFCPNCGAEMRPKEESEDAGN